MLAVILQKKGIAGFEFASGIPGTIGGAIRMNAGAYGKEMKEVVENVTYIDEEGNKHKLENEQMDFSYRHSRFKEKQEIIIEAQLKFQKEDAEKIKERMDEYRKARMEKQPIDMPSAGSTFKRGTNYISAKLIDDAGLKGYEIGGAQVSEKHAGFIVNKGNATAQDILDLIESFEIETFKYNDNENLDNDMQYIYSIEKEVKKANETELQLIYKKLISTIGIIRFKYGFESEIIKNNPNFKELQTTLSNISLNSNNIINQYNEILAEYNNKLSKINNMDFIENKYKDIYGKEGLFLAVESLKSLISNDNYRQLLNNNQIKEIITDCIKLNNGKVNLKTLETKYKEIITEIWKQSLSNKLEDNKEFKVLFSNISGGSLTSQAELLINRPMQSSCSMISSNFIATYGSNTRKIGFIYPNDTEIIMASAYDLGSNVFGVDSKNKEKGTTLTTPSVIERIGKERAKEKGEDLYSSTCYNEILVNAKPCGIVIIGLGEKDINIDYQEAKDLSLKMNLPIYFIDTMQYKDNLSESDKNYIAFHSLLSYLGISTNELMYQISQNNGFPEILELINTYQEQIVDIFLTLKQNNQLNKENMCKNLKDIIDISNTKGKSR